MTNTSDNKSADNWLHDITDGFMEGQDYVILVRERRDVQTAFDALREILTAPTIIFTASTYRIEERRNKGIIYILRGDQEANLRGLRRDFKLVDPLGLASEAMRHRFK